MHKHKRLTDAYRFPGFTPSETVKGVFGDPKARVIELNRRQKKQFVRCVAGHLQVIMTASGVVFAISRAATRGYFWRSNYVA